ncbi:MAG: hypothetical protein LAP40_24140 [Acidobacteriia bacterium]|nr:hypothetical protein [Terriglobia bacterium]
MVALSARPLLAASHDCVALNVPGNPTGINNAGIIVGSGNGHGYIRDAAGNVTLVDYPGTTSGTVLISINNNGIITGMNGTTTFTVDLSGNFHTFTIPPPYNADPDLLIYGINDDNVILGSAIDPNTMQGVMFLLHPDGTITPLNPPVAQFAGGLNNSYQYLSAAVPNSRFRNQSYLVNPDGSSVQTFWSGPGKYFPSSAFGLNNGGTVVGYTGTNPTNPPTAGPPWASFVREPSGVFSGLQCDGLDQAIPNAINDKGVIVGTSGDTPFVGTPVPGTPKLQFSVRNLTLPPELSGTPQSAPGNLTVTNVGDARLDLGAPHFVGPLPPFSPTSFQASACMDNGTAVVSLNPGESCTVTVTAISSPVYPMSPSDTLYFDDSSAGSPHSVGVSVPLVTAPSPLCQEYAIAAGPPRQANFVAQDNVSGLASITALTSTNATVTISTFPADTRNPVVTSATQIDPTQPARVQLQLTTKGGVTATCGTTFGVSQWSGLGASLTGRVAVARNSDGRLQAFVRAGDNSLQTIAQTAANSDWSAWTSLGGVLSGDPVVGVNSDGRLQVFARGADGAISTIAQSAPGGSWSAWQSLSGDLISDAGVATDGNGNLQIVAVGSDQALWLNVQTSAGVWSGWNSLGGAILHNPAFLATPTGGLQIFAVGAYDNAVWTRGQSVAGGTWSDWTSLGGSFSGDPIAVLNQDGRLQVLGAGTDNALWTAAQSTPGGSWSTASSLGGVISSNPAVALNSDGRLEVFARGWYDNALWHLSQTAPGGNWSGWTTLNGVLQPPVSAAQNQDGRLAAFVEGGDTMLWIIEQAAPGVWN